jgi:hypothetical protein
MKQLFSISLAAVLLATTIMSCKKDKNNDNKKIVSMAVNGRTVVFSYDAQGRLQRIDHGVDFYILLEHNAAGIILQQYDAAGTANPAGRCQFNVVNGRIITAKESTNVNGFFRNHFYDYDAEGRLMLHYVREVHEPTQQEIRNVKFFYNYTGKNASRVTYLHQNGGDPHASDSASIDLSYYEGKKLYTYADIGFNYFGSVSVGMHHQGHGIPSPVNRIIPIFSLPANNPVKSNKRTSYSWNTAQNRWVQNSSGGYDVAETDYVHDAEGYLIECSGSEIKWQ